MGTGSAFVNKVALPPIGSFVRYVSPPGEHCDRKLGRVMAHEMYRDENGDRWMVYVRWLDCDGIPKDQYGFRVLATELEIVE